MAKPLGRLFAWWALWQALHHRWRDIKVLAGDGYHDDTLALKWALSHDRLLYWIPPIQIPVRDFVTPNYTGTIQWNKT